jgi:hypothetical protein
VSRMRLSSLSERLLIVVLRSIIPSEDAHQSEYVAPSDKRREWISWCVFDSSFVSDGLSDFCKASPEAQGRQ